MNTNDFNYGQTVSIGTPEKYTSCLNRANIWKIFLVCFLSAELPSGLVSKRLGADVWIPFLMVSWSIVAGSQAFIQNRASFFAIKALLGLLMGGFIP
jgi:hypothetical protein